MWGNVGKLKREIRTGALAEEASVVRGAILSITNFISLGDNHMSIYVYKQTIKQTNSVALSPRENYTDFRPPLVDEI
jgi:hypothetical protein